MVHPVKHSKTAQGKSHMLQVQNLRSPMQNLSKKSTLVKRKITFLLVDLDICLLEQQQR